MELKSILRNMFLSQLTINPGKPPEHARRSTTLDNNSRETIPADVAPLLCAQLQRRKFKPNAEVEALLRPDAGSSPKR